MLPTSLSSSTSVDIYDLSNGTQTTDFWMWLDDHVKQNSRESSESIKPTLQKMDTPASPKKMTELPKESNNYKKKITNNSIKPSPLYENVFKIRIVKRIWNSGHIIGHQIWSLSLSGYQILPLSFAFRAIFVLPMAPKSKAISAL